MTNPFIENQPNKVTPVSHLADVVKVERRGGGEPANLDLVALATLVIQVERELAGVNATIRDLFIRVERLNDDLLNDSNETIRAIKELKEFARKILETDEDYDIPTLS